ncbi:MAG: Fe2+-dependent dioxygenase [Hyphomicrobium sp.]|nr:Fe2+-dependent dioxygenase [Hyphomicrobium sp.]
MILQIGGVLSAANLLQITTAIGKIQFHDGRATAGWHARTVKDNLQAAPSELLSSVQAQVSAGLMANDVLRAFALPARVLPPLISRYTNGASYGLHVDDALMGTPPLRTDLSVTVFLSPPEAYEGGELEVQTPSGIETAKFAAGDAAIYPSTCLHQVTPVTRGERLVAATWIQSQVRNAEQRAILFDLDRARRKIFASHGKCEEFDLIAKSYANLLRQWAEI